MFVRNRRYCSGELHWWLYAGLFFLFSFPISAMGRESIRVAIADDQRTVTLRAAEGLMAEGASSGRRPTVMRLTGASLGKEPLRVRPMGAFVEVNGTRYRGAVEVRRRGNGRLLVINDLDLEAYLQGVVAAEIPHDWEMEALKAQAVASRTYALRQKRAAGRRPYHILATVDSQVYLGALGERPRALQALQETRGEVLLYQGELSEAFYHASCGGRTEDAAELWGIDAPYLKGVDCGCQEISTYGVWERRFSIPEVLRALRREGYRLNAIDGVAGGEITPAGRMRDVRFRHAGGTLSVPAEPLRAVLGYSRVPSIFFEPELDGREVVFSGRGLGHGVGLCQWGAREMAGRGHDYRSILAHYYPGTVIGSRSSRGTGIFLTRNSGER
jgi:stage II sporulation protein D